MHHTSLRAELAIRLDAVRDELEHAESCRARYAADLEHYEKGVRRLRREKELLEELLGHDGGKAVTHDRRRVDDD